MLKMEFHQAWLIDINQELLAVYRQPEGNSYRDVQQFFRGDILTHIPHFKLSYNKLHEIHLFN